MPSLVIVFAAALLWFSWFARSRRRNKSSLEWAQSIPGWIYFVYGLAVSTGVAGSIGLFMRKGWTVALFAICLAAVIVQMFYTMIIGGGMQVMGPWGLVMPSLVIVFSAALLWFSWFARSRSWFGQVSPTVERE